MTTTDEKDDVDALEDWAAKNGVETEPPPVAPVGGFLVPGGSRSISVAAKELYEIIGPQHEHRNALFRRGSLVVTLDKKMNGEVVLQPLQPTAARSLFEDFVKVYAVRSYRDKKPAIVPSTMAEDTARALLNCRSGCETLPAINGLVNCPVLHESDGKLRVCNKGYDAETGLLVCCGGSVPDVPVEEAVAALRKLLADFHFESPADESRAMASFLTPALKMGNLITGYVPIDVAEADQSQSGKTYRQRMVAAIYGEESVIVPLKNGGVGSVDESFFEKLVNGRPFIQFDNFRGRVDSAALESFLTSETFPCRIAGRREIEVDPRRFFVQLSSNGVETTRDLANRSCIVRIRKRERFLFAVNPLKIIRENQGYYLGCVFALVREWFSQGKPQTDETRHAFHEWSRPLDWIVQNLCGMPPLLDGHSEAQVQVSDPALTFLRQVALEIERQFRFEENLPASQLYEIAQTAGVTVPGLRHQGDADQGAKTIGARLGPLFNESTVVAIGGFTVERTEISQPRDGGEGGNRLKKFYRFTKSVGG